MEFVQGKELIEFMDSLNNKMKTNIKMRVTPEQSRRVQEICFENGIGWGYEGKYKDIKHLEQSLLFIYDKNITFAYYDNAYFVNNENKEIDADLFIKTNGTCEETQKPSYRKTKILNQKKELHKLNLKLQKCISLEEHRKVINWHIERNESLFAEIDNLKVENTEMGKLVNLNKSALDLAVMTKELAIKTVEEQNKKIEQLKAENKSLKESSKISCNMLHSQKDKIGRLELNYVVEQSNYKKEIEKLKAVIEYLESKVK